MRFGGFAARFPIPFGAVVEKRGEQALRISKDSMSSASDDSDGTLTILTRSGHRAFRGSIEGDKERLGRAFAAYGYRWRRGRVRRLPLTSCRIEATARETVAARTSSRPHDGSA